METGHSFWCVQCHMPYRCVNHLEGNVRYRCNTKRFNHNGYEISSETVQRYREAT